jgi:glyceraldehyde-3-phosphate dehydrogenase/erythrose-4-phosphate dehydrogenase
MTLRVAIEGFDRIGCNIVLAIVEYNRKDVTVVATNDAGGAALALAKQI